MTTNIYIQSDFIEKYDKYLHDPMGEIRWKRLSRGGRNRREIFKFLENYTYYRGTRDNTIPNGTVKELYDRYKEKEVNGIWNGTWKHTGIQSPFHELVIYEDEMAHRGEGKVIMNIEEAIETCPDSYASVFLHSEQNFPISYRNLYIGAHLFRLVYVSLTDDWRSNCGHTIILYKGHLQSIDDRWGFACKAETFIETPIFAFDYIEIPVITKGCSEGLPSQFYMDFNEAPGIPEEVIVKDYNSDRYGECIPFSELVSFEDLALSIEKCFKS